MATQYELLKPTVHHKVIDLVEQAGIDVSDWQNFERGSYPVKASTNPKYCYSWSFVKPSKVVVLNLWYDDLSPKDGLIAYSFSARDLATGFQSVGKNVLVGRARKMDDAIRVAFEDDLPVRVIVCEGTRRRLHELATEASHVKKRLLDAGDWAVTAYNKENGYCTLTRGAKPQRFADQFSINKAGIRLPDKKDVTSQVFIRSAQVRRNVLARANGRCELCKEPGFRMKDGRLYLETHHVIPLSEDGPDIEDNVIGLCPTHHREAHYGERAEQLRESLLEFLLGKS